MGSVSGTASAMRGCGSPRRHRNLGPCGERWHSAIRGAARTRPAGSCTARRAIRAGPEPYPEKDRCRAATILKELLESAVIRQRCREYGAQIDGAAAVEKSCLLLEWLGRA